MGKGRAIVGIDSFAKFDLALKYFLNVDIPCSGTSGVGNIKMGLTIGEQSVINPIITSRKMQPIKTKG